MINNENIFEKGMLLSLTMRCYTAVAGMEKSQLKDLPTEIVRGKADLLIEEDKEILLQIRRYDSQTHTLIESMTVPFPVYGIHFVLSKTVLKLVDLLKERQKERLRLIELFLESYSTGKEKFKKQYPTFYEAAIRNGKYPTDDELRSRFIFQFKLFQVSIPNESVLKSISPDLIMEEMNKFKEEIKQMKRDVESLICNELLEKADALRRQAIGNGTPNQKTFNSLNEFFNTVKDLYSDFIDREDVSKEIEKFKKAVGNTTAEDLRMDETFKEKFGKKMEGLAKTLQKLPDVKMKRFISF